MYQFAGCRWWGNSLYEDSAQDDTTLSWDSDESIFLHSITISSDSDTVRFYSQLQCAGWAIRLYIHFRFGFGGDLGGLFGLYGGYHPLLNYSGLCLVLDNDVK